uniref:NtA domain-containing protein n=1 Tax=Plectus sambesii TaxID=2011161 RepID=A0A914VPB9_9BILA
MRLLIGVAVAICSAFARKHPCFDNSTTLFAAVENAQLILTGTVVRMTVDVEKKSLLTGVVRVKRVIKGSHLIGDQRQLTVFGFGDSAICESFAHKSDTKIFLLSQRNESFYLNSSLVPITLKNLDVVNAAITGKLAIVCLAGRAPVAN